MTFPTAEHVNALQDALVYIARVVTVIAVLAAVIVLGIALGGCGTYRAAASVERKVGDDVHPCLTTLPTRAKLGALAEPEKIAYLDEHSEPRTAMRVTVDAESASAFFNYVQSLEAVARRALGCVTR